MITIKRYDTGAGADSFFMSNENQWGMKYVSFDGHSTAYVEAYLWEGPEDDNARVFKVYLEKDYMWSEDAGKYGWMLDIHIEDKETGKKVLHIKAEITGKQAFKPQKKYILTKIIRAYYDNQTEKVAN